MAVGLAPQLLLLTMCLAFPTLAGLTFGGRDVTWLSATYNWFALVALVAAVGLAAAAVTVARSARLVRLRRSPG